MKRSLLVAAGLAALLLLVLQAGTQPPAPASPDAIEQVASLETPRAGHTRQAEWLEAPSTGFRVIPGEFPDAYHFATATLLPSGEVAIIGGYGEDNNTTAGVWRFRGAPARNDSADDSD